MAMFPIFNFLFRSIVVLHFVIFLNINIPHLPAPLRQEKPKAKLIHNSNYALQYSVK